jgi:hypothetical protein
VKVDQVQAVNEQSEPVALVRDPQRFVSDSFSFSVQRE